LKNNTQLNFRVTLGPGFPAQAPVVNLLAKGEHQFLDSNSVVTHPKLRKYVTFYFTNQKAGVNKTIWVIL
jgi:hypothetical protein